ncbi:TIGR01777 family oxidoreductase [Aquibacillus kalidii]|uniref:TIGR01777 family oxidoreductase n=1 Tax=Aquibacillus kalidii TaxID=2762597 RepID=UPI0016442FB9|nr:TIGR01777 family oxidoreductase [Aquibacillus kalidii]
MNILLSGGTGFIGQKLTEALVSHGHKVYILTRSPQKHAPTESITYIGWLSPSYKPDAELPNIDAIVNLAGDSLFGYWTEEKKENLMDSRMKATESIINLISNMENKPAVLINASAVGFYGTSTTETFTEHTTTPGKDFLSEITFQWEQTALQAESLGVRTVLARLGVVLGHGGALPLMALPFKLFVGGRIGSGEQWVSWVHIDDVIGMIEFAINNSDIKGAMNVTAPFPLRNKEFSKVLAKALNRPYWLPVPSFFIKNILGEMSTLIIEGQCVIPEKAHDHRYTFIFPRIDKAFGDIF